MKYLKILTPRKKLARKERKTEKRKEKRKRKLEAQENTGNDFQLKKQKKWQLMSELKTLRKERNCLKDKKAKKDLNFKIQEVYEKLCGLRKELKRIKFEYQQRQKKDWRKRSQEDKKERNNGQYYNRASVDKGEKRNHMIENNLSNASWETAEFVHARLSGRPRNRTDRKIQESSKHERLWDKWSRHESMHNVSENKTVSSKKRMNDKQKQELWLREPKSKKQKSDAGFRSSLTLKR